MPGGRVDTTARIPALRMEEQASDPAAPAAGYRLIYPKAGGWYGRRSDGTVELLTGLSNPMTGVGDLIIGGASGAPTRKAPGTNGHVLTMVSGSPDWAAPSGGGGGTIHTNALASPPASPADGDVWLPSTARGLVAYRVAGAWQYYREGQRVYLPPAVTGDAATGFVWVNQGTATVIEAGGVLSMTSPVASGQVRSLVKNIPGGTTPWQVTAQLRILATGANFSYFGMMYRQSSNGYMVTHTLHHTNGWGLLSQNITDNTGTGTTVYFNAHYPYFDVWFRLRDDGTNRIFSWGPEREDLYVYSTVGRTSHITADQVGILIGIPASVVKLSVLSWQEETV